MIINGILLVEKKTRFMSKYEVLMMHCQVLCAEKLHLKSQLHYSLVKGSTIPNERNLAQWKRGNTTRNYRISINL